MRDRNQSWGKRKPEQIKLTNLRYLLLLRCHWRVL